MMALYLLLVIAIWVGFSVLLFKAWQRWRSHLASRRRAVDLFCAVLALAWLSGSFWFGGGRKIYYDLQVSRMCREDGGVIVYEAVKLPKERFDDGGMVKLYRERKEIKSAFRSNGVEIYTEHSLGAEYTYSWQVKYLRNGNPSLSRMRVQVTRRLDNKLLGQVVYYKRGGGDMPGPWHGSSFMCPELGVANDVLRQVFVQN